MIPADEPHRMTKEDLYRKVAFPRQHGPKDFFKLAGKAFRYLLLGTLVVGQLTLTLWHKHERLIGATRQYTYIERIEKGFKHEPIILSAVVAIGNSGTYGRDATLPGWNHTNNTVDCIGGGGGGAGARTQGGAGAGGGGGGMARYTNVGALGATFSLSVGNGGAAGGGNGNGAGGGNTQLDGWVGAYGGGGGVAGGAGGAGGTYYAGTGYYAGGGGGACNSSNSGGGGGAAGRYGGGSGGRNVGNDNGGGNGGPSGGGAGGKGQTPGSATIPPVAGGNGTEYGSWGSGGGGGGSMVQANGAAGGYYGGGGGGGDYFYAPYAGGPGAQGLLMMMWEPLTAPVISSISPNSGPTAGGQAVAIYGSGFYNITSVNIGGAVLTGVTYNANAIYGTTAAGGAGGPYAITVNVSGGVAAGTSGGLYYYVAPPTVSGCAPSSGPTTPNNAVLAVITGTNMTGVSSVTFGGVAASPIQVVSANQVNAWVPAHAAGLVNVAVANAYGGGNANVYTYVTPPSLSAIASPSPALGLTHGGTDVTLTGADLSGVTSVMIGGIAATNVVVVNANTITCRTPAHDRGLVSITATNGYGTATLANCFTYLLPAAGFNMPMMGV